MSCRCKFKERLAKEGAEMNNQYRKERRASPVEQDLVEYNRPSEKALETRVGNDSGRGA